MRALSLTKINHDERPAVTRSVSPFADSDDPTENTSRAEPLERPATEPVIVNADAIRCFYARDSRRGVGTRITFVDGGGFAVAETFDVVRSMVTPN